MSYVPTDVIEHYLKEAIEIAKSLVPGFRYDENWNDAQGSASVAASSVGTVFYVEKVADNMAAVVYGLQILNDAADLAKMGDITIEHNEKPIFKTTGDLLAKEPEQIVTFMPRILAPGERFAVKVQNKDTAALTVKFRLLARRIWR